MNFNKLLLGGRLTRDPSLKEFGDDKCVCEFAIAVNGYREGDVTFIDCKVWGKAGRVIQQHLTKGDPIFVDGELKVEKWETQDGQKRSKAVCNANGFQFVGGKGSKGRPDEHTNDPDFKIDF